MLTLALIHFADGSTLQIYGNAELLVDERVHGDEKAQSKRIRLSRGSFQFIARRSSPETILLDTPLAHIRNVRPASLFGSFTFGVLTLALVDELKAASSELALLDDETITYKDIKHGVFVVVTKEAFLALSSSTIPESLSSSDQTAPPRVSSTCRTASPRWRKLKVPTRASRQLMF